MTNADILPGVRLLTVPQAAEYLALTTRALYNLISARKIEFVRMGRRVRFDRAVLDQYIEVCRVKPITPSPTPWRPGGSDIFPTASPGAEIFPMTKNMKTNRSELN